MQHFSHLSPADRSRLFERAPQTFTRESPREMLACSLGATLYVPATRAELAATITRRADDGVVSMVICLEDAVADADLPMATDNLVRGVTELHEAGAGTPLLFIRIREPEQLRNVADRLGPALAAVSGFVLPKFDPTTGDAYLEALRRSEQTHGRRLFAMPVLESPAIAFAEQRHEALTWARQRLLADRERILAVRLGATDLCGLYGLRRTPDMTIYDVRVVSDMIVGVLNHLSRAQDGFVVTGPVWEYFNSHDRLFRPRLRQSIFAEHNADDLRAQLMRTDLDGLIREVELDKSNGILGKTVIHPSHVPIVHSLLAVSHEEFADASDVLSAAGGGGVAKSGYQNKMNESKPHLAWAFSTVARADAFGVLRPDATFVDVLAASRLR